MNQYPDLTSCGYRIDCELGHDREGGRITWKGIGLNDQKIVLIKQFCFNLADSSWSGYRAYEQEITILKGLKHSHIPRYLDSIETEDSFYLIQEYIDASNLCDFQSLTLTEIKQITLQILNILVYLQNRNIPILHLAIKPENILLDQNLNAYLINFSFASFCDQELGDNTINQSPSIFCAPEQMTKPNLSSDLYSLGVTLVYLLTDQDISIICKFTQANNHDQLELKKLLPSLEQSFFDWLDMMIQASVSKRFANAATARNELLFFDPQIEQFQLENNGTKLGIQLTMPKIVGVIGIAILSAIATWSINFVEHQIRLTFINIAIALVAVIAISVTQLGAISIANLDQKTKISGLALGTITPVILVFVSTLIWGVEEAVAITTVLTVAEILILAGFWWKIPAWPAQSFLVKFSSLSVAIILGASLTLQLI